MLAQSRQTAEGIAAVRRAISLEDENWRHHLRFAYVSWGDERLRSAGHALKLFPGFAFGHWLAATVHVSRGALEDAQHELEAGTAAQVRLARGDDAGALQEFEQELALEDRAHIYTRQVCAHTRCAVGALHLRQGDRDAALAAFERAKLSITGYPLALAAAPASRPQRSQPWAKRSPAGTPRLRRAFMRRSGRRRLAAMAGCCRLTRS